MAEFEERERALAECRHDRRDNRLGGGLVHSGGDREAWQEGGPLVQQGPARAQILILHEEGVSTVQIHFDDPGRPRHRALNNHSQGHHNRLQSGQL